MGEAVRERLRQPIPYVISSWVSPPCPPPFPSAEVEKAPPARYFVPASDGTLIGVRCFFAFSSFRLSDAPRPPKKLPRPLQDGPRGPHDAPKTAQEGPQTAQEPPKAAQEGPQTAQEPPKTAQEAPETGPRGAPEGDHEPKNPAFRPKRPPGGPKRPQRGPKNPPRGPQDAPRGPQEAQKRSKRGAIAAPKRPKSLIFIYFLCFWPSRLFGLPTL